MRRFLAFLILVFCPATAVLGGAAERPLRVCMVSGSWEYKSDASLTAFKDYLEKNYNVRCVLLKARARDDLPGLEALGDCDVALFFTRRLTITGQQLERVKRYCLSGRPLVGVRTASHGFQNWLAFDKLVLGGNYNGHYKKGVRMKAVVARKAESHPIVRGIDAIATTASLYRTAPLAADCNVLLVGKTQESKEPQPVAWTRIYKGARIFYTSLGAPADFRNEKFRLMLARALFWAARRESEIE